MAGELSKDAPRGSNATLNWYDNTRPMFIDLVGDYAGKELFLVEGDSLLRVCFEDERIEWPAALSGAALVISRSWVLSAFRWLS
jgi:ATP-dependent RNA helicase DDX60